MLQIEDFYIKTHIMEGGFGLEKESLRILEDGSFAHTEHPFPNEEHIVKDFCENQIEINTSVNRSVDDAVCELEQYSKKIQKKLFELPEREFIWQFSNPPYIKSEDDIPVAAFEGDMISKTYYRDYLSDKYGRYKMTFSGIHFNYSFDEKVLERDYKLSGENDFFQYKNQLYLNLAEQLAAYGWLLTAVTAASPLMDSSFVEKGVYGTDVFTGMASVRCSELGYWNDFAPVFDYTDINTYVDSIKKYVEMNLLKTPSELYFPIRLKPPGENNLKSLRERGVNHIELRMFDLNPLQESGIDTRDIRFAQMMIIWLASTRNKHLSESEQIQSVQNFKKAAHYDLKTVKIVASDGIIYSVAQAALKIIDEMRSFFVKHEMETEVQDVLDFEYSKFIDADNRYAWKIRNMYKNGFVEKGIILAKERQEKYNV